MTQILPPDSTAAVKKMIALTRNLQTLVDSENRAVAMNDGIGFSMNEPDKTSAADQYEQAAAEFVKRKSEFKQSVNPALFDELIAAQESLKQAAVANNVELGKLPGVANANDQ
jgi:hypothetical protein